MYLAKLNPKSQDLWQRPKKKIKDANKEWFDNIPLGRDPMNDAMKNLSNNANLSMVYTNHCIRATIMEVLDEGEFASRHIMAQTGHCSEQSIKTYARKCPAKKKREMNNALKERLNQDNVEPAPKVPKHDPPPQQNQNISSTDTVEINFQQPNEIVEGQQEIIPNEAEVIPFPDEEIKDEDLIKVLEKIEEENSHIFPPKAPNVAQAGPLAVPQNAINFNQVANISNVTRKENLPIMFFPNSNVTINYNFNK